MSERTDAIIQFHADHAAERGVEASLWWLRAGDSSADLDIVADRYGATAHELADLGQRLEPTDPRVMGAEEWDRFHALGAVGAVDVASFFAFASILLDVLAKAVGAYGGRTRGLNLRSHHRLTQNLPAYAAAVGLVTPTPELMAQAKLLYERVTETRNKVFMHPESWRESLGGHAIGPAGMTLSLAYHGDLERHPSRDAYWTRAKALMTPVPAHLAQIEAYVVALLTYLPSRSPRP